MTPIQALKDRLQVVARERNLPFNEGKLNFGQLKPAVMSTFSSRGTALRLIKFDEISLKALQKLWMAHLNGLGGKAKSFNLPKEISEVIAEINKYIAVIEIP